MQHKPEIKAYLVKVPDTLLTFIEEVPSSPTVYICSYDSFVAYMQAKEEAERRYKELENQLKDTDKKLGESERVNEWIFPVEDIRQMPIESLVIDIDKNMGMNAQAYLEAFAASTSEE